jgi:AcrR family transcriptional regulator
MSVVPQPSVRRGGEGRMTAARRVAAEPRDVDLAAPILRAAASAFMLKGFAATSIDDVAEVLGCTKGRIYHHFRSKVDLFFEVHHEAMSMVMSAVRTAAAGVDDPLARIAAMSRAHVLVIMREIAFQCVVVQGLEMHLHTQTTPKQRRTLRTILALRDDYEGLFVDSVEQAIACGQAPSQDARVVVKALLGAMNWTTIWYRPRRGETEAQRRAMADSIALFCLRGLGGRDAV